MIERLEQAAIGVPMQQPGCWATGVQTYAKDAEGQHKCPVTGCMCPGEQ